MHPPQKAQDKAFSAAVQARRRLVLYVEDHIVHALLMQAFCAELSNVRLLVASTAEAGWRARRKTAGKKTSVRHGEAQVQEKTVENNRWLLVAGTRCTAGWLAGT